jgi:hypothetical protein
LYSLFHDFIEREEVGNVKKAQYESMGACSVGWGLMPRRAAREKKSWRWWGKENIISNRANECTKKEEGRVTAGEEESSLSRLSPHKDNIILTFKNICTQMKMFSEAKNVYETMAEASSSSFAENERAAAAA